MKTPFEAAVSRVYPHIVTRGARNPSFWSITISNRPLVDGGLLGPYAFFAAGMLDASGDLTVKGRQTIDAHVAGLAKRGSRDFCVVWSENKCTWYDRYGKPEQVRRHELLRSVVSKVDVSDNLRTAYDAFAAACREENLKPLSLKRFYAVVRALREEPHRTDVSDETS